MKTETLELSEIERRYADRWVILDDVRSDFGPVLRGGRVIFDTEDEDLAYQKLRELPHGGHYAIRFMGEPPPDISFAL